MKFKSSEGIGGFGKVWNPPTTLSRAIWTLLSLKKVEPKERTQLNERTEAILYDTPAARDRRSRVVCSIAWQQTITLCV